MTVRFNNILLILLVPMLLFLVYLVENKFPEVTQREVSSPALHQVFGDRLVAHITDRHLIEYGWLDVLTMKALTEINPDMIFFTGDLAQWETSPENLVRYLKALREIAPTVLITGNNDYCCLEKIASACNEADVLFLKNEAALIKNGRDSVYLIGLEDNFLWKDDYFKATEAVPANAPRIVLGHAPAIVEKIDPAGVELILSGHLHGGQINLPFMSLLMSNTVSTVSKMYTSGMYEVDGIKLYSNRGLGTSLVPLRFLSRPEIAIIKFIP